GNHRYCQQGIIDFFMFSFSLIIVCYLTVYQNLAWRVLPSFSWNLHITPYFPFLDRSKSAPKCPCIPINSFAWSDLSGFCTLTLTSPSVRALPLFTFLNSTMMWWVSFISLGMS